MPRQEVQVKRAPLREVKRSHASNGTITVRTKYSKQVHKKIVDNIRKGRSVHDSSLLSGLSKYTLDEWLWQAKKEPEKHPEWVQLAQDIEMARAEFRGQALENIVTVGNSQQAGTWQANAWLLERTDPENWGRKDKVEHVGQDTPRQQINTVVLIDADARDTARDLLRRIAGHASPDVAIGPGSGMQLENGDS